MNSARGAGSSRALLLAPLAAGFVCLLVGFTSSCPNVLAAADAMGMSRDQIVTMTLALSLAMGLTTLLPSLWLRIPVVTAWSTPGAALLVTSLHGLPLSAAIGAFALCGLLLVVAGVTASGVTLAGIGSAFWAVTAGVLVQAVFTWRRSCAVTAATRGVPWPIAA